MKKTISVLAILLIMVNAFAVEVKVSPKVKKSIKGISTLDRGQYFNVHSRSNDADMKAFYSEYNVMLQGRQFWGPGAAAVQQTGEVGVYPSDKTVKNEFQETRVVVATEHPHSVFKRNLDNTALANWVVEYYSNWEDGVPLYYEPMNEPFVHASDFLSGGWDSDEVNLIKEEMAEMHSEIAKAVHASPYLKNMKVIGFGSAYPHLQLYDFGLWETDWKMFIDVAGAEMDAYAIHMYDGINVSGEGGRRVGSYNDAILDMIDAYTYLETGTTKPFVVDEYGGIESGYTDNQFNIAVGQPVRSQMSLMLQYLDRPDRIEYSIPFTGDKAEWHITAENDYRPYGATLLIDKQFAETGVGRPKEQVTEWVYTDRVYLFEMWKNVNGDRVDVTTDNPDIFTIAYLDGDKLYIALNNADDATQTVNLSMLGDLPALQSINAKSMQVNLSDRIDYTETALDALPSSVEIKYGQTLMYECTFATAVEPDAFLDYEFYYGSKYLESVLPSKKNNFDFEGVELGSRGVASINLGISRDIKASMQPTVKVNGTEVDVPINWKGYDQADKEEFFGVIEVPVPFELLTEETRVQVIFDDSDQGYITSVILNVGTRTGATAIKDTEAVDNTISVYPNPSNGTISLSNVNLGSEVDIYSLTGQLLRKVTYQGAFDVNLRSGIYLLEANGQVERFQVQ